MIWLEAAPRTQGHNELRNLLLNLKAKLKPYGLGEAIALYGTNDEPLPDGITSIDVVSDAADLLLDMCYSDCREMMRRFRRSALIDIDPGLTQIWIRNGGMQVASHDLYFTIGEHVAGAGYLDCGLPWIYTPPCVALDWWPACKMPMTGSYTTVSQWYGRGEWFVDGDQSYDNSKRAGFLPFLDLPKHVPVSLELALDLGGDDIPLTILRERGWRAREAAEISSTPWDYKQYIQGSRGEFSCVKPSCVRLQNAWISDRTLCYLASAKPAVIEHTGPSHFLPDAAGLLRFTNLEEAVDRLKDAEENYDFHSKAARALAEEFFDAKKVAGRVLEWSL